MSKLDDELRTMAEGREKARKKERYELAIKQLQKAMTQLEPDGLVCAVCKAPDHYAAECNENLLVVIDRIQRFNAEYSGRLSQIAAIVNRPDRM